MHPKVRKWEQKLKEICDEIDDYLEDTYGTLYPLHPSRADRGATSNKEHDGLFNIGASFTPGFGSRYGRGYVVDIDMVTLDDVPEDVQKKIEKDVLDLFNANLPLHFPGRNLRIDIDRNTIKIHGDLSLGTV